MASLQVYVGGTGTLTPSLPVPAGYGAVIDWIAYYCQVVPATVAWSNLTSSYWMGFSAVDIYSVPAVAGTGLGYVKVWPNGTGPKLIRTGATAPTLSIQHLTTGGSVITTQVNTAVIGYHAEIK